MCPLSHSLSFLSLFPLPFALSPSHFLFLFRFHFTLLTLPLPTLRRPPRGGPFSVAEECTWDRSDKRNCANKYAHADNCTINRSWLKGPALMHSRARDTVNVLWISFHETTTVSLHDTVGRSCALVALFFPIVLVFFMASQNIVSARN